MSRTGRSTRLSCAPRSTSARGRSSSTPRTTRRARSSAVRNSGSSPSSRTTGTPTCSRMKFTSTTQRFQWLRSERDLPASSCSAFLEKDISGWCVVWQGLRRRGPPGGVTRDGTACKDASVSEPTSPPAAEAALAAQVAALLAQAPAGAVVLERIARGGGQTNWYVCRTQAQLAAILAELSPGACVSFYLDGRIGYRTWSPRLHQEILRIIRQTGDCVIGQVLDDIHLEVDFIAGPRDLQDYAATLGSASQLYIGPFPGRDNDGRRAITVILPDADGVVRAHPY